MPRGGARVGAGRPKKRLARVPDGDGLESDGGQDEVEPGLGKGTLPLEYMLAVMNDPKIEESRRDRLAVAAAPYCHPKIGEGGKKEQKKNAAKTAGAGKFSPQVPPKLVVNNR